MDNKFLAEQIFMAAVESVLPEKMIRREVVLKDDVLEISGIRLPLDTLDRIYIIGAGKASGRMALEIENILGEKITAGHVITKYGHTCELKYIYLSEASHPVPDENGIYATESVLGIADKAAENDLVICLISGGGSSLLADVPEGLSISDLIMINNELLRCGADIREINTVRKHLSKVKGGQLARAAMPATVISLILSDVIGDPLDVIASGPTVPDNTTFNDAWKVIKKYDLISRLPHPVTDYLQNGIAGIYPDTPKKDDAVFNQVHNIIVGNNKIALEAAVQKARELGLNAFQVTSELTGDTTDAANHLVNIARSYQADDLIEKPCCLLFGGETTVKVKGTGVGGRNQHLALLIALLLRGSKGITLLAAGTDGNDGPTEAAGAVVDNQTFDAASNKNLDARQYLSNFDSFHFFKKAGGHIITDPTGTNVMDVIVILIE